MTRLACAASLTFQYALDMYCRLYGFLCMSSNNYARTGLIQPQAWRMQASRRDTRARQARHLSACIRSQACLLLLLMVHSFYVLQDAFRKISGCATEALSVATDARTSVHEQQRGVTKLAREVTRVSASVDELFNVVSNLQSEAAAPAKQAPEVSSTDPSPRLEALANDLRKLQQRAGSNEAEHTRVADVSIERCTDYCALIMHVCARVQALRHVSARLEAMETEATHVRVRLNALSRGISDKTRADLPLQAAAPTVASQFIPPLPFAPAEIAETPADLQRMRVDAIKHRIEASLQKDVTDKLTAVKRA